MGRWRKKGNFRVASGLVVTLSPHFHTHTHACLPNSIYPLHTLTDTCIHTRMHISLYITTHFQTPTLTYIHTFIHMHTYRRRQAVLADPLFLQHHAWMGLEKERLELLLAHVKAQRQR